MQRDVDLVKRGRMTLAVFAVILIGIGLYYHFRIISPTAIGDAVGTYYHESHPVITVFQTREDFTLQPMNLIKLRGRFTAGNLHANSISFSILANGTYLWAMAASKANHIIPKFLIGFRPS